MKILLSNDDGVFSLGVLDLAKALFEDNEVLVVAPSSNASGVSRKINIREYFSVKKLEEYPFPCYALDGSPVDCIDFALGALNFKPDLIISGINDGMNIGSDAEYSGTVGAATEGAFWGYKSLAFSAYCGARSRASDFTKIINYLLGRLNYFTSLIKDGEVLNINVPLNQEIKSEKICKLAKCRYLMEYVQNEKGEYLHNGIHLNMDEAEEDTDLKYIQEGYVTVTPLTCDMTDHTLLKELKNE